MCVRVGSKNVTERVTGKGTVMVRWGRPTDNDGQGLMIKCRKSGSLKK